MFELLLLIYLLPLAFIVLLLFRFAVWLLGAALRLVWRIMKWTVRFVYRLVVILLTYAFGFLFARRGGVVRDKATPAVWRMWP